MIWHDFHEHLQLQSQNPDNKDQDNTKPADSVSAAKTGDTTNIMMPVLVLLIGMGGVCIFIGRRGVKNSK